MSTFLILSLSFKIDKRRMVNLDHTVILNAQWRFNTTLSHYWMYSCHMSKLSMADKMLHQAVSPSQFENVQTHIKNVQKEVFKIMVPEYTIYNVLMIVVQIHISIIARFIIQSHISITLKIQRDDKRSSPLTSSLDMSFYNVSFYRPKK